MAYVILLVTEYKQVSCPFRTMQDQEATQCSSVHVGIAYDSRMSDFIQLCNLHSLELFVLPSILNFKKFYVNWDYISVL